MKFVTDNSIEYRGARLGIRVYRNRCHPIVNPRMLPEIAYDSWVLLGSPWNLPIDPKDLTQVEGSLVSQIFQHYSRVDDPNSDLEQVLTGRKSFEEAAQS
jgi:hypothetical protein